LNKKLLIAKLNRQPTNATSSSFAKRFAVCCCLSLVFISCQNQEGKNDLPPISSYLNFSSIQINPIEDTLKHLLADELDTLELFYINWACTCPNWADISKIDTDDEETFYVEAADSQIEIPYGFPQYSSTIRFIGKRYKEKSIPKNNPWANPEGMDMHDYLSNLVFRYYSYEVVKVGRR
jgi:hypothetical protein